MPYPQRTLWAVQRVGVLEPEARQSATQSVPTYKPVKYIGGVVDELSVDELDQDGYSVDDKVYTVTVTVSQYVLEIGVNWMMLVKGDRYVVKRVIRNDQFMVTFQVQRND